LKPITAAAGCLFLKQFCPKKETMYLNRIFFAVAILLTTSSLQAQSQTLSVAAQTEDFNLLVGGLQEGHAGLYYFLDKKAFDQKCDSLRSTFREGETVEVFYLKLRLLIASLHHGHTRVILPGNGNVNYKMSVLDSTKRYLPFQLQIIKNQLVVMADCSQEQLIPKYSVVKSINNISSKKLIAEMLPYMPADGINQTFKTYCLSEYFYFHYLFNLLYPGKEGVKIEVENNPTHFYIQLLTPGQIDRQYREINQKSISAYGQQLAYNGRISNQTAYLKLGSFYKGFIENFGQRYEPFLDSCFADMQQKGAKNLILDLRNNEGGGDNYDDLLLSYLVKKQPGTNTTVSVPGRVFAYKKYAGNSSEDVKTFMENPGVFLTNDTSLVLKNEYTGQMDFPTSPNLFSGNIYVLTNGGTFSSGTAVVSQLYYSRLNSTRKTTFIGEENGGDIYAQTGCAGQSYVLQLPNSNIRADMPFLCFGQLNKVYPKRRLPDYEVYPRVKNLAKGLDDVLVFAIKLADKR
jgi:Peptidase family S41